MPEDHEGLAGRIATWAAAGGGMAIALGAFIRYVQIVDDVEVEFATALAWWGAWAAGLGLVIAGLMGRLQGVEREQALLVLLVGLLVLVIMPVAPGGSINVDFGGMFGG